MSPHGRARMSRRHPEASGVCDRCDTRWTRSELAWQFDWAGLTLQNKRILVCRDCLDDPSNAYRTILIKPDPLPVRDPRPVAWPLQELGGSMRLENGSPMLLETGSPMYLESLPAGGVVAPFVTPSVVVTPPVTPPMALPNLDFSKPLDSEYFALLGLGAVPGGSGPPPPSNPSLDFSNSTDSQYLTLLP